MHEKPQSDWESPLGLGLIFVNDLGYGFEKCKQVGVQVNKPTNNQTSKHAGRRKDRGAETETYAERNTETWADRKKWSGMQAGRQTDMGGRIGRQENQQDGKQNWDLDWKWDG